MRSWCISDGYRQARYCARSTLRGLAVLFHPRVRRIASINFRSTVRMPTVRSKFLPGLHTKFRKKQKRAISPQTRRTGAHGINAYTTERFATITFMRASERAKQMKVREISFN